MTMAGKGGSGGPNRRQLRNFGLTVGIGFVVLGILQQIFHGKLDPRWCYGGGAALVLLGLIAPGVLRPVEKVWMTVGNALGHVMSRVLLGLIYFGIFAPIALARRAFGIDRLGVFRRPPSPSYWVPRGRDPVAAERYERQF